LFVGSLDSGLDREQVDPDNFQREASYDIINLFSQGLTSRIPIMNRGVYQSNYVGLYDTTPDEHPIIDELDSLFLGNVFCCVGLSGHGFKLCPAFGLMNAEMLMRKEKSELTFDRSAFSLRRFSSGEPLALKTKYENLASMA
jgi:sarcosine oxidase, subunit beta